jgi:adenine phosphoribosyltransferase
LENSDIAQLMRTTPDQLRQGIAFRDTSTLLLNGVGFRATIDRLADEVNAVSFEFVGGIEARGFIVAAALAYRLNIGTLMIRKAGKLPGECVGIDYELEYGSDRLEMYADACARGSEVLLVDDLLATAGTALAAFELLRRTGANVRMAAFVTELPALGGARRLAKQGLECKALVSLGGG